MPNAAISSVYSSMPAVISLRGLICQGERRRSGNVECWPLQRVSAWCILALLVRVSSERRRNGFQQGRRMRLTFICWCGRAKVWILETGARATLMRASGQRLLSWSCAKQMVRQRRLPNHSLRPVSLIYSNSALESGRCAVCIESACASDCNLESDYRAALRGYVLYHPDVGAGVQTAAEPPQI